jgi:threonine synthase
LLVGRSLHLPRATVGSLMLVYTSLFGLPQTYLKTALPAKFAETIQEALGRQPERPAALEGIENLPQRSEVMDADLAKLKAFITANVPD